MLPVPMLNNFLLCVPLQKRPPVFVTCCAVWDVRFHQTRSCTTHIFNDNFSIAQNVQNSDAGFSKKHVAISYNVEREAVVAGIIEPYWISGGFNMSDILTK